MKKSISCYIISETRLGLQCAVEFIKENNNLLGIISSHDETLRWADKNNITIIPSLLEFQELNPYKKFDYLFSIVNTQILPSSVLQLPRCCIINYHDSPLPRYAGVHATSWALLNRERAHGVSWHKMQETVDTGSILKQAMFSIKEDDTALSLNLKCYIHALESFRDLIKDLEQDLSLGIEQDLSNRSYYARQQKPSDLGFISWFSSAQDIERQFRALYFGEYQNTLATFKVFIGNQIFIPTEIKVLNIQSKDIAGTITNITDEKIQVSTETQDIALAKFKTVKGQSITIQEIKQISYFDLGYNLQSLNTNLTKKLYKFSNDLSPCEIFWIKSILTSSPATLPFMRQSPKIGEIKTRSKKHKIMLSNEKFLLYSSRYYNRMGNNYSFTEIILTAFVIYLNCIGNISPFSVGFVTSFLQDLPLSLQLFFPQYVPLTYSVLPSMTISDLVGHIQNQMITAEKNKAYFNDLSARFLNLAGSYTELPIVVKVVEEFNIGNEWVDDAVLIFSVDKKNKTCVIEIEESLIEPGLSDPIIALINYLPKHFEVLVEQIIENPYKTIGQLSLLTEPEKNQLLIEWNNTKTDYTQNKTIYQLFEEQVERTPNNIAAVFEGQQLTYQELNSKANQLAYYLRKIGVSPDTLVAIAIERSLEMIIGLLGILKAGGAYVPLDPSYPVERLQFILEDTQASIIITEMKTIDKLPSSFAQVICLDGEWEYIRDLPSDNLNHLVLSCHLAYIIYTSGSTGQPKGVMIEHRNLINYINHSKSMYDLLTGAALLHSSTAFDMSITSIFLPIVVGNTVHILPQDYQIDSVESIFKKHSFGLIKVTPSHLKILQSQLSYESIHKQKGSFVVGGENLLKDEIQFWLEASTDMSVFNEYGPTETTVGCCVFELRDYHTLLSYSIPIGRPISNTQIYILDKYLNPVPIGISGDIYIGGAGLARGYLNRPDLTADRFIPNPFVDYIDSQDIQNFRLYRTGDLARYLLDGNIEFLGRIDDQVKIRGFRIELGEIEAVLSSYKEVKQSVVLAKDQIDINGIPTGNKYLVAYFVKELDLKDTDAEDFVSLWRTIYQSQYLSLDINNFKQNIKGWNSSYIDEAIDKKDMLEWVNATTDRIRQLNPRIILEIGSGSGLILFNIIDNCSYYYATDFSKNAINYTNKVINKFSYSNKVSTLLCSADKISYNLLDKDYDTVVINSVTQYFPDLDYFELVITQVILNMNGSGKIFIGDIRDYRLLKCFHYSVQNYKNKAVTKGDVEYFVRRDKELLISPEYFIYLQTINRFISHVEVMAKIGIANNEMNNYRYDVILHIKKNNGDNNEEKKDVIDESNFVKVLDFESYLASNVGSDILCIKYPNKRIIKDFYEYNKLFGSEIEINQDHCNSILSVNEILEKVENKNYKVKFLLDIENPLYLNIIVHKDNDKQENSIYLNYFFNNRLLRSDLASNPLIVSKLLENQFGKELKKYLSSKLPEYMVPEYYISLENLPLTINGKLDRKALPDPEFTNKDTYIGARNELEAKICQIWSEVLGIPEDKIGIHDNFFEIGGHSLLLLSVFSKVKKAFLTELSLADIFTHPTISSLKNLLDINRGIQSCLLPIQLNGSNLPLFLVHAAAGLAFEYRGLTNYFKDIPIYGIINPYRGDEEEQFNSIEDMAKYYIQAIQKVCPSGPYHLGGFSFGGWVAYEMAVQLKAKGYEIMSVILIDSSGNFNFSNITQEKKEQKKLKERVLSEGEKIFFAQLEKSEKLGSKYTPSSYKGRVILLKAYSKDSPEFITRKGYDNGWGTSNVLELPLEIYSIDGTHKELFEESHLPIVAKKIEYILQNPYIPPILLDLKLKAVDRQLFYAVQQGDVYLASKLLEVGADINAVASDDKTVLDWVNTQKMATFLIENRFGLFKEK